MSKHLGESTTPATRFVVVTAMAAIVVIGAYGAAAQVGPAEHVFRIAITESLFQSQVNVNDAKAATRVWIEEVSEAGADWTRVDTMTFQDTQSLEQLMSTTEIQMVVLTGIEYAAIEDRANLDPVMTTTRNGNALERYLLLGRTTAGTMSINDVRGKSLVACGTGSLSAGMTWLDTLLLRECSSSLYDFFSKVTEVDKPQQAVLPVFFGQSDLCLVSEFDFNMIRELNPQIGKAIAPIVSSPKFLSLVLCFTPHIGERDREMVIEQMRTYHQRPRGQQVLTTFKMDRFAPYQAVQMDALRKLRADQLSPGHDTIAGRP